jgi:hypothetical protein
MTRQVFAVDISPDRGWASIGVAGRRVDERTGIELVDRRAGTKWLLPKIIELHAAWHPARWVIDPRAAAGTLIDDMIAQGIPVEKLSAQDVAHSCGQLFDALRDREVWHFDQPPLTSALAGADKRPLSEAWAFDRRNTAVDLSPLMAVSFALWGYTRFGAVGDYTVSESVHFDLTEIVRMVRAGAYGIGDLTRLRDSRLITEADLTTILNELGSDHVRS